MSTSSMTPVPKVQAATAAAALATLIVLIVSALTGKELPIGLEGALATVLAFAAGYMMPDKRNDPATRNQLD